MMVIQGTVGTLNPGIFPADRCLWEQRDATSGNGYEIAEAVYIPGANTPVGGATGFSHAITDPVLGYIGKSGRFVALTE